MAEAFTANTSSEVPEPGGGEASAGEKQEKVGEPESVKNRFPYHPVNVFYLKNAVEVGEVIHELTNTTNVIDFLRGREKNSKPERLREAEVMRMLGAADEIAEAESDGVNDYIVGERVKVTDGPFKDFSGIIEEVNREKRKLKVMIKIFDRKTPLELDNSQVERE